MDILIIDAYVDEPGLLGVPPYLSPEPRMLVGVARELDLTWEYITADEYRVNGLPLGDIILVHGGVTVPGKYLGGTPLSIEEAEQIAEEPSETFLGGPLARYEDVEGYDHYATKNLAAYFYDSLFGEGEDRWAEPEEIEDWLKFGHKVVERHPFYPDPLLLEMTAYRGCPRYFTGGCSFCSEPAYGKPNFRDQKDIIEEFELLYEKGIRNFRLGGQSCTISYRSEGVGEKETVAPRPEEIEKLFRGIEKKCPDIKVLHVDNANPAVIAEYPERSEEILETLVEYTTSGNVLALGMETADKDLIEENNLNSTPGQVKKAVRLINKVGRERGASGMPELLPGLNFLGGLKGETRETYEKNYRFLEELLEEDLLLRRINIRQVLSHRDEFEVRYKNEFKQFKKKVRENIDNPMLKKMLPVGTLLKDVYMEKMDGKTTFGRQIGTYPLLVGIEYQLNLGGYYDVRITDHGQRSVTGVHQPLYVGEVSFRQLQKIPGIGKKRAATIFRERPSDEKELEELIENKKSLEIILKFLNFKD
ncbi:MAG: radical SAM protein [Candidatus Thermoplasmatota archaeon]|nr:radical SAM protein [Candidatus Thermoplasmatota archaeon]MBS3790218.1 radical SAM protein [Candidatus Thermoplasmatota archaeon]